MIRIQHLTTVQTDDQDTKKNTTVQTDDQDTKHNNSTNR